MGNYLSSCKITLAIKPSFEVMCRANNPSVDVAVNRVYMAGNVSTPSVSSYLAFPPLPPKGRYISVALFLKSPSAGVTRYPCPVEPGLSSRPAFRPGRATVCLTRLSILAESDGIVNAWPQCGLHIGGSRQGLPLKIPDGPQSAVRSRLHGPAAPGEKVWEGEGRGCIFFRSAV